MSLDLFGEPVELKIKSVDKKTGKPKTNPLIAIYGICLDTTKKCRDCEHQYFKDYRWSKCNEREKKSTHHGASTDHSSRYNACGKFINKTK